MPTYNKPGVYSEETLSPNIPVQQNTGPSTAAFIGVTDRGPTNGSATVYGVPTLVNSWTDFVNVFGFGANTNIWTTAVGANDLKYAVKTYFDNGGTPAWVLREANTDATAAKARLGGHSVNNTAITATAAAKTAGDSILTFTYTSQPTTLPAAGSMITLTTTSATPLIANASLLTGANRFIVTAASSTSLSVVYNSTSTQSAVVLTDLIVGSVSSTAAANATLSVKANSEGAWANNVWYSIKPSYNEGAFDLTVYYDAAATTATDITDADAVERWYNLRMDVASTRYAPSIVNSATSSWVTLVDNRSTKTANDLPTFTGTWSTTATAYNAVRYDVSQFTDTPVKLGVVTNNVTTTSTSETVTGGNGSASPDLATTVKRLEAVDGPLVVNRPGTITSNNMNTILDALGTRPALDAFAVFDIDLTANVSSALQTLSGITSTYRGYGAAYYPGTTIVDPASPSRQTRLTYPGGAVVAEYITTDARRGVFKAPAGTTASLSNVVSMTSLSSTDFNSVSQSAVPLNIIRYVPGAGYCIMGARTFSNSYVDRYVPTRRSLIYIKKSLSDLAQFAVFEPNTPGTWAQLSSTLDSFLYSFWRQGGLVGASAADAYFVKCDSDTNTSATIAAGELRAEVGVALSKPAEFVIIRIGQTDGGISITTTA